MIKMNEESKEENIKEGNKKASKTRSEKKQDQLEQEAKGNIKKISALVEKRPVSDKEAKEKQHFFDYLAKTLNIDSVLEKTRMIAYRYHENYEMSWKGMENSIRWFIEVQGNTVKEKSDLVGIIPYVYEQSKQYYDELERVQSYNAKTEIKDFYKTNVVKIPSKEEGKRIKQIDISTIK